MAISPLLLCVNYSLLRHHVLWYSSEVVAAAELGDALCELVVVEANAVVSHHHAVITSHDDDLQLYNQKQPGTRQYT